MMTVEDRSFLASMACSPPRIFQYSTDVKLGTLNSFPPLPMLSSSLLSSPV